MKELSKEKLLEELDKAVGIKTAAYEQIKKMIKGGIPILWRHDQWLTLKRRPSITEEWVKKKADKLASIITDYMPYGAKSAEPFEVGELQDFIRSLVEEIEGKIGLIIEIPSLGKKRRGGCPPDFISGAED